MLFAQPAFAARTHPNPGGGTYSYPWKVYSTTANGDAVATWHNCTHVGAEPYVQHPSCSVSTSYTTTVSGSVTVPAGALSEAVGYSVSTTYGVTGGDGFDVPANVSGYTQWGPYDQNDTANQRQEKCLVPGNLCEWLNNWAYAHTKKYLSVQFRFERT